MAIEAKICGINSKEALDAALHGGAAMVGFNFFPASPRAVTPEEAAALGARVGGRARRVGVFVEPGDETLERCLAVAGLDMIQLHGQEEPSRVAAIRQRVGLPVIKAIKVATAEDLDVTERYAGAVDRLLFDAKAPKSMTHALPGGNAVSFDWRLLSGRHWPHPWMLSGGLRLKNLDQAIEVSGATAVDVSSGVETRPGVKDPAMIAAFLERLRSR